MAPQKLDPARVPLPLQPLIPIAERWGLADLKLQEKLLHELPLNEVESLYTTLYPLWDEIDQFTRLVPGELASQEVRAFNGLYSVLSEAFVMLSQMNPARALEIVGYPEAFPRIKFDAARLPQELQPIIPHAVKWVIEDDGIRHMAIDVASSDALDGLKAAVDGIGRERVEALARNMVESKERETEGYVFLILLELADQAAYILQRRRDK
jgi:hypothetical protein